jgi:hypothetical protein
MSISYQPKDAAVQEIQLKVQELVVKKSDSIVSVDPLDGKIVTIDLKEPFAFHMNETVDPAVKVLDGEVRCAIHCDDSFGLSLIGSAGITLGDSSVTLELSNDLEDEDAIILKYCIRK